MFFLPKNLKKQMNFHGATTNFATLRSVAMPRYIFNQSSRFYSLPYYQPHLFEKVFYSIDASTFCSVTKQALILQEAYRVSFWVVLCNELIFDIELLFQVLLQALFGNNLTLHLTIISCHARWHTLYGNDILIYIITTLLVFDYLKLEILVSN